MKSTSRSHAGSPAIRRGARASHATSPGSSPARDSPTRAGTRAASRTRTCARCLKRTRKRHKTMHLHILGICGTFMGGIAAIAKTLGHTVSGCDANVYPPMSTQLAASGIVLTAGYGVDQLDTVARNADVFVVGNAISRGNPLLEAILDRGLRYTSGPQWLFENVLRDKWVLAVAGTHGKTTATALLAWILDHAGVNPGFLIGGVAIDFGISARMTDSSFFVIEADEYDTAFSD